ncbi:hypothetical protein ACU4GD_44705 [Cupriavidus basilensis]
MHLVMVPNPPFHPGGDFALGADGVLLPAPTPAAPALTFGNIGLYDTRLFIAIEPGQKVAMTPYYRAAVAAGLASRGALRRHLGKRRHAGPAGGPGCPGTSPAQRGRRAPALSGLPGQVPPPAIRRR